MKVFNTIRILMLLLVFLAVGYSEYVASTKSEMNALASPTLIFTEKMQRMVKANDTAFYQTSELE